MLLLDNPLTGLDPRDAAWWLGFMDRLSAGHPLLDGRPVTLVVSCDDFRPWLGRARQFAVLRERRLVALPGSFEPTGADEVLRHLLGARAGAGEFP